MTLEDVDLRFDLRAVRRRTHADCCAYAVLRQGAADHSGVHLVPQEEQTLKPDPFGVVFGAADAVALTPIGFLQLVPEVVAQVLPLGFGDVRCNIQSGDCVVLQRLLTGTIFLPKRNNL